MAKTVSTIIVSTIDSGKWVNLIELPLEKPLFINDEELVQAVESTRNLLYTSEKVFLTTPDTSLVIRNCDKKIFSIKVK